MTSTLPIFRQNVEELNDRIVRAGLRASMVAVQNMAHDLLVKYDKRFLIDGTEYRSHVVVYLGLSRGIGPIYADPTHGRIIHDRYSRPNTGPKRENIHAISQAGFLTEPYTITLSGHRQPFCRSPEIMAGLITPMSPEALALIRLLILPVGLVVAALEKETELPDFDNLAKALRLVSPLLLHDPKYAPNMIPLHIQHTDGTEGTGQTIIPSSKEFAQGAFPPTATYTEADMVTQNISGSLEKLNVQRSTQHELVGPPGSTEESSPHGTGVVDEPTHEEDQGNSDDEFSGVETLYATKRLLESRIGADLMQYLPSIEHATFKKQDDSSYLPAILSIGLSAEVGYILQFKPCGTGKRAPRFAIRKVTPGDRPRNWQIGEIGRKACTELLKEARKHFVEPFATAHNHIELLTVAKYYFVRAGEAKLYGMRNNAFPMTTAFESNLKRLCKRLRAEMVQSHYGVYGTNNLQEFSASSSTNSEQLKGNDAGSDEDDGSAISAATRSMTSLSLKAGSSNAPAMPRKWKSAPESDVPQASFMFPSRQRRKSRAAHQSRQVITSSDEDEEDGPPLRRGAPH
ncbi:hypothetical protein BKA63DRAFT_490903 [Paraphoma chrysanthemicola]|nr:hypothetical protein BKA63DRAFT_490903 [Paraphoma chrysanthemicola]